MRRSRKKSIEAPENDSAASRAPGITESSMPRSRKRAAKSAALRASRAAEVATATVRITGWSGVERESRTARNPSMARTTRSIASGLSSPVASTPSPRLVMAYSRVSSWSPDSPTSTTSMRHVTVPMSIAAYLPQRITSPRRSGRAAWNTTSRERECCRARCSP